MQLLLLGRSTTITGALARLLCSTSTILVVLWSSDECASAFLVALPPPPPTALSPRGPKRLSLTAQDTVPAEDDGSSSSSPFPRLVIVESDFPGAGVPRPELSPSDIPTLLMMALENNDFPTVDAGLHAMWEFSSDTTKFIFQNNRTEFVESAHETAAEFPTSLYGASMNDGASWEMETKLNRVGGKTGWIATQVCKTICSDGRLRRWQWELRKHRRPPNLGSWYVESVGSSDRKGRFEPEE